MKTVNSFVIRLFSIEGTIKAYPSSKTIENDRYYEYPDNLNIDMEDIDLGERIITASKRSVIESANDIKPNHPHLDFGYEDDCWLLFIKKTIILTIESHPAGDGVIMITPSIKSRNGFEPDYDNRIDVIENNFKKIGSSIKNLIINS